MNPDLDDDLAAAVATLATLEADAVALQEQIRLHARIVRALQAEKTRTVLTGKSPATALDDPDLMAWLVQNGHSGEAYVFLTDVLNTVAPEHFFDFDGFRRSADNTLTAPCPHLQVGYQQDTTLLRAAVLRLLPHFALDGYMLCRIFDNAIKGVCYADVYSNDKVVIRRNVSHRDTVEFEGTLDAALSYIAEHLFYGPGPDTDN